MGKIRLSAFRRSDTDVSFEIKSKSLERIAQVEEPTETRKSEQDRTEHVETADLRLDDASFPILPKATKELPFVPSNEVKKRDGKGDGRTWIVVDDTVLDVTEYQNKHPGGRSIIAGFAGQDCTWQWYSFHNRAIWESIATGLRVGRAEGVANPYQRPRTIVGLRKHGFNDWD